MDMRWFAYFITTTGCTGMLAKNGKGAGTIGALVALLLQGAMLWRECSGWMDLSISLASLFIGAVTAPIGEAYLLERDGPRFRHTGRLVEHDFNETNIDEFHGQMLAGLAAFIVAACMPGQWMMIAGSLVISFIVFRIYDAKKIGLVRVAEQHVQGGWGIMLDDTVAGVYGFLAGLLPLVSLFWR